MQPNEPTPNEPTPYEPTRDGAPHESARPDAAPQQGYAAPPQQGYAAAPQQGYAAPPHAGDGARPPMPAVVKWGLGIQWVGIALTVILILLGFGAIALLAGAGGGSEAGLIAGIGIAALAIGLVIVAVQVLFLIFATKGRNWARWALAIVAAIGLVLSLVSGQGINIGTIVSVVAIVLLFLPDANAWYAAAGRAR